jgi:Acetyltransferase (GNAT) domain
MTYLDAISEGEANLGYWLDRPHWGLGYAFEAAQAVVRFAFDDARLVRLELDTPTITLHLDEFWSNSDSNRSTQFNATPSREAKRSLNTVMCWRLTSAVKFRLLWVALLARREC